MLIILIYAIFILMLIVFGWAVRQPELWQGLQLFCLRMEQGLISPGYDDNADILAAVRHFWNIVGEVKACRDNDWIDAYFYEIEFFEAKYRDVIPDVVIENYVFRLRNIIAQRREELNKNFSSQLN